MSAEQLVVVMRGISGSGKSHYVAQNFPEAIVCSADEYFYSEGREYRFCSSLLIDAHGTCWDKFLEILYAGAPLIVVDNTNVMLWEAERYWEAARSRQAHCRVIRLVCNPLEAASRNVHGVPLEQIQRRASFFEAGLPEWREEIVFT